MSIEPVATPSSLTARVAARGDLTRDELIELVADLHALMVSQQATVTRQAAAISALQQRAGTPAATPVAPAAPAARPAPPESARRDARLVAGSDFTIVFDGGALGNPGRGYGSYQIVSPGGVVTNQKRQYEGTLTNNQAELMTLINALRDLQQRLGDQTGRTKIAIRGDSQLALNTISGRWKARHPNVVPLVDEAKGLLRRFGGADIKWQSRTESVAILGH